MRKRQKSWWSSGYYQVARPGDGCYVLATVVGFFILLAILI